MIYDKVLAERKGKAVYKVGNTVVKLFDSDIHPKSDILNEALNQARVEETGLPIPDLKAVSIIDGKWAITLDYVEGKTLQELIDENPDKVDEYLNLFVDLQLEIHSKKAPLLNKLKDKMNRKISSLTEVDATTRFELHTRLESMPKHIKVCHGDFEPSNIIIDNQGKAHILDWSHATQGNASADVARTYLLFLLNQPELADRYLKLFCAKSNTAKQYVQHWLPIVAASQMIKGEQEEKEFLMRWVDVVKYE
ncbi:MAG: phosphotransferase [Acutalibacteraceae bacterium]|nr:phosphotransferase [Acutalibacteraceae bacterium]